MITRREAFAAFRDDGLRFESYDAAFAAMLSEALRRALPELAKNPAP